MNGGEEMPFSLKSKQTFVIIVSFMYLFYLFLGKPPGVLIHLLA